MLRPSGTGQIQLRLSTELVRPAGIEPATYWFEASRSIRVSYGRIVYSSLQPR